MFIRLTSTDLATIATALLLLLLLYWWPAVSLAAGEEKGLEALPDWAQIMNTNKDRLAQVESDEGAKDLFVGAIGRAAALHDVAATLAVQGMRSSGRTAGSRKMRPGCAAAASAIVVSSRP